MNVSDDIQLQDLVSESGTAKKSCTDPQRQLDTDGCVVWQRETELPAILVQIQVYSHVLGASCAQFLRIGDSLKQAMFRFQEQVPQVSWPNRWVPFPVSPYIVTNRKSLQFYHAIDWSPKRHIYINCICRTVKPQRKGRIDCPLGSHPVTISWFSDNVPILEAQTQHSSQVQPI